MVQVLHFLWSIPRIKNTKNMKWLKGVKSYFKLSLIKPLSLFVLSRSALEVVCVLWPSASFYELSNGYHEFIFAFSSGQLFVLKPIGYGLPCVASVKQVDTKRKGSVQICCRSLVGNSLHIFNSVSCLHTDHLMLNLMLKFQKGELILFTQLLQNFCSSCLEIKLL